MKLVKGETQQFFYFLFFPFFLSCLFFSLFFTIDFCHLVSTFSPSVCYASVEMRPRARISGETVYSGVYILPGMDVILDVLSDSVNGG